MKKLSGLLVLCAFLMASCSGADSVIKKRYRNHDTTLNIIDLTSKGDKFMDAGARLHRALEDSLSGAHFIVLTNGQPAKYHLKYKVVRYVEGNRAARFAALGMVTKAGKAQLKVNAALFHDKTMLGRWDVESWLNDGFLGGNDKTLFAKAADKIVEHLNGDY